MEWVETTGRTVEEAQEAALDELGVDRQDAEFQLVTEARVGLFGRLRSEARVRARVRPTAPRAKDDRRDRRRRQRADREPADDGTMAVISRGPSDDNGGQPGARARRPRATSQRPNPPPEERSPRPERAASPTKQTDSEEAGPVEVALEEQGQVAQDFLRGLIGELGLGAAIRVSQPDDETIELGLEGDDLGLLIGQKGATLFALQDLTRTVVQRRTGASNGRLFVDVSGYRHKRHQALARFAEQVADQVRTSGSRRAMEPMNASDRKVVHDTINGIEGVHTTSEGEEPRRYVVVLPLDR